MNILICDDDKICVERMKEYVQDFFRDRKIADYKIYEYFSGEAAARESDIIDIAFLDVEMEDINGIEASKILRKNNKGIVVFIITSYMGYLDDAMDEGVFRYINKPLDKNVISRGLRKAVELCYKKQSKKIVIKESKNNVIIEQDDIIYIESIARKRCVYTEKQEYLTLESLAYWKKLLDDDMFFLVNKSIIVNIKKVEQFSNNNIRLKGIEQEIPLSRDRKSEFKQKLLLYLAGQE